ncbi:hypothetical protein CEXT_107551 [Caerostris extrusa]|uniref:Uncharacterized protein n=1 Tax=Caerostris extrusa TaxID=172846 RepID=A0AAV4RDW8_CAEEX|nr:hypothetical protein CEXT_107551 [Caerostris extrusa]
MEKKGDDLHYEIMMFSNDEDPFGAREINLNAIRANFQRRLTKVRDTPVIESPIQIDAISSTSVMPSKLENCLGSLVETTTSLSEASSVAVQTQKCFNQPKKMPRGGNHRQPCSG